VESVGSQWQWGDGGTIGDFDVGSTIRRSEVRNGVEDIRVRSADEYMCGAAVWNEVCILSAEDGKNVVSR
jgi:hypothetical protein